MMKVVRPSIRRSMPAMTSASVVDVERRGRLVEDQDRRVAQQRAGDRHALLFALGERHARLRR